MCHKMYKNDLIKMPDEFVHVYDIVLLTVLVII